MNPRRTLSLLLALAVALTGALATAGGAAAATFAQPSTWNFTAADIPGAAALGNGGAGVTVAVLDTWLDSAHPEFGGRVLAGYDCGSGTCVAGPAAQDACEPHATHVAGIVASKDYGVAPAATILPVRVLAYSARSGCVASPQAVANGIVTAVNAGARVINVSLGADDSSAAAVAAEQPIVDAANTAAAAGVLVIFAAGNSGNSTAAASFGPALIVGSAGPTKKISANSNSGATLLAPGGDSTLSGAVDCGSDPHSDKDCILSTWYCTTAVSGCDPHGLAYLEGTSMAAPVVAGLGALLFAQKPGRSLADVVSVLESTAHATGGSQHGLVDGCAALLKEAKANSVCGTLTNGTRKLAGCPKTVTVKAHAKPTVKCHITPKQAGIAVSLQVQKGKAWKTVATVKTAKDGSFTLTGPKFTRSGTVRVLVGKVTAKVAVTVRR